jgi:hypothetical protein
MDDFDLYPEIPKPRNQTCYDCADDQINDYSRSYLGQCSDFRALWRKFLTAKKKSVGKSDYRNELLHLLKAKFGKRCDFGIEGKKNLHDLLILYNND